MNEENAAFSIEVYEHRPRRQRDDAAQHRRHEVIVDIDRHFDEMRLQSLDRPHDEPRDDDVGNQNIDNEPSQKAQACERPLHSKRLWPERRRQKRCGDRQNSAEEDISRVEIRRQNEPQRQNNEAEIRPRQNTGDHLGRCSRMMRGAAPSTASM